MKQEKLNTQCKEKNIQDYGSHVHGKTFHSAALLVTPFGSYLGWPCLNE